MNNYKSLTLTNEDWVTIKSNLMMVIRIGEGHEDEEVVVRAQHALASIAEAEREIAQ